MITTRPGLPKSYRQPATVTTQKGPYLPSKASDRSYSVIVDEFNSAYWSGLDVSIYFNDIYVDDIVNVQYQVTESVMPIYSWGDYKYRYAGRGVRIINGSFSINFKRSFYIPLVLRQLMKPDQLKSQNNSLTTRRTGVLSSPKTVEEILGAARQNKAGELDLNILNEISKKNSEKFWEATENANPASIEDVNAPLFNSRIGGFTIYLKFGEPDLRRDESVVYGSDGLGLSVKNIGTIEALTGVELTGNGKVVDDSGRNIMETYSFIARDLVPETGSI